MGKVQGNTNQKVRLHGGGRKALPVWATAEVQH